MSYVEVLLIVIGILIAVVLWRYPGKRVTLAYPIGLQTMADPVTVVIPAGVPLPYYFSDLFRNAEDDQARIAIALFQIRDTRIHDIDSLTLDGLPPRPAGMLELEIRLMLSKKKRLKVVVKSPDARLVREFGPYPVV